MGGNPVISATITIRILKIKTTVMILCCSTTSSYSNTLWQYYITIFWYYIVAILYALYKPHHSRLCQIKCLKIPPSDYTNIFCLWHTIDLVFCVSTILSTLHILLNRNIYLNTEGEGILWHFSPFDSFPLNKITLN